MFVFFKTGTRFFFTDLHIIVRNIFYVLDSALAEPLSVDLQKALIYRFIFVVLQIFKSLLWLHSQTVQLQQEIRQFVVLFYECDHLFNF